jgi:hypothetical protein
VNDLSPILSGARFRIRDCWPTGLRHLTSHLTPWTDGKRELRCGAIARTIRFGIYTDRDGAHRWHGRLNAGHATQEGKFAPSLDVLGSGPHPTPEAAMAAADAAILDWFAARIADGSVIYPWPAVPVQSERLFP